MTDKLIERIKADREAKTTAAVTRRLNRITDMEARIIADDKIIKAAEELAEQADMVAGTDQATQDQWDGYKTALEAYRAAVDEGRG